MKHKRVKHEFSVPEPERDNESIVSDHVSKLARAALDRNEITQMKIGGYDGLWHVLVRAKTQEACLAFEKAFREECEREIK